MCSKNQDSKTGRNNEPILLFLHTRATNTSVASQRGNLSFWQLAYWNVALSGTPDSWGWGGWKYRQGTKFSLFHINLLNSLRISTSKLQEPLSINIKIYLYLFSQPPLIILWGLQASLQQHGVANSSSNFNFPRKHNIDLLSSNMDTF